MSYKVLALDELQPDLAGRLAANAFCAGIPRMIEYDPNAATPEEAQAADDLLESYLATKGLCLIVLSPLAVETTQSLVSLTMTVTVPLAIIENRAVNLSATGLKKSPLAIVHNAMRALLGEYKFDSIPFARPDVAQGLHIYYVRPSHVVTLTA